MLSDMLARLVHLCCGKTLGGEYPALQKAQTSWHISYNTSTLFKTTSMLKLKLRQDLLRPSSSQHHVSSQNAPPIRQVDVQSITYVWQFLFPHISMSVWWWNQEEVNMLIMPVRVYNVLFLKQDSLPCWQWHANKHTENLLGSVWQLSSTR